MSSMSILKDARDWARSWEIHLGFHLAPDGKPVPCACWPGGHCNARSYMRPGEMLSPASSLERLVKLFRKTADELAVSYRGGWRGEGGREEFGRAVAFLEKRAAYVERVAAKRIAKIKADEERREAEEAAAAEARLAALREKYPYGLVVGGVRLRINNGPKG